VTTKQKTLAEAVASSACARRKPKSWLERLSPEQHAEISDIKRAWRAGEFQSSALSLSQAIHSECAERGIPTCGPQGIRKWLAED
jgi:hypothetical protein